MKVKEKIKEIIEGYKVMRKDRQLELRMYKVRWIWYHTILAVELAFVIYFLYRIHQTLVFPFLEVT